MILLFLQGIEQLPAEVTSLLSMAVELPPIARIIITSSISLIGFVIFITALICLTRAAHRQEKLQLTNPLSVNVTKANDTSSSTLQNLSAKPVSSY